MTDQPEPTEHISSLSWGGVTVQLSGPGETRALITAALPTFWTAGASTATLHATVTESADWLGVELPDELSAGGPPGPETVRMLASRIELALCARLPDRVGVHAGVVAHEGRAILLPGTSMSGKSTLTQALVDAGATYLSDEYALLDADGLVWPYARPMSLRQPVGRDRVLPERTADPQGPGIPIATIAALTFTGAWDVEPMSPADGALVLLSNCLTAQTDPARSLAAAAKAAEGATALRGTRDDAAAAAARLLVS